MKKVFMLGLMMTTLFTTSTNSFARCQDQYFQKIKENKTFSDKFCQNVSNCEYGLWTIGYLGSYLIVGFASAPFVIAPTVAMIADDLIEDAIHDHYYRNIIRLTNYAEYVAGTMPFPNPNTIDGYEETVVVPSQSSQAKNAKRHNRHVRRENIDLVKIHQEIRLELTKSEKTFVKLYNQVSEKAPGLSMKEMANIITEANNQDLLCNGVIGTYGEDVSLRGDYVVVNGPTRKEKRQERKHNREVTRHNNKVLKKLSKNKFAQRDEIIEYIVRESQE